MVGYSIICILQTEKIVETRGNNLFIKGYLCYLFYNPAIFFGDFIHHGFSDIHIKSNI